MASAPLARLIKPARFLIAAPMRHAGVGIPSGASIFPNLSLMPKTTLPPAATPADLPGEVRLQIVSHGAEPPASGGWLHEIKHDGHRLVAIVAGERLKLVSRNGFDRT